MATLVTCPQGHRWEISSGVAACPVCGADPAHAPTRPAEHLTAPSNEPTPRALPAEGIPSSTLLGGWSSAAPPSSPPVAPGYEILALLGRGGMGIVYKARQVGLNRLVALKMISGDGALEVSALARFRAEAQAVARLGHPNIVQIYEVSELPSPDGLPGRPFFSMEYAEGGSLARRLARELPTPRQAAELVEILARAMHYAHQRGIVHRDLKPGNVLLDRDGTPKVSDFGLARHLAGETGAGPVSAHTRSGDVLGTPGYMAPEQAEGRSKDVGPAADVYALGAILYECLTGRPPFEGRTAVETLQRLLQEDPEPPARLRLGLPRDLQTICLKCLEKEPIRRYLSAEALADDLRAFLLGEPIQARPTGLAGQVTRWARRRPTLAVLVAVGAVAVLGVLAGAWWHSPLAAGGLAVLGLLAGAGWYGARLHAALREVQRQQALAERGMEHLYLLLETTRRLIGVTQLDELLRLLGETTARLTNAERATIYLLDRSRGELWSKVAVGDEVGEIRVPVGKGIAGLVAATGETINLEDPYADPRFNPEVDRRTGYTTRSLLTLPMTSAGGAVLGVFQVLNKRSGAFGTDDVAVLHALASSAALAVEHAQGGSTEPPTEPDRPAPPAQGEGVGRGEKS
jgi:serine/threonine-protein kinase